MIIPGPFESKFIGNIDIGAHDNTMFEYGEMALLLKLKAGGKRVINYAGDSDPNLHRNGTLVFIPDE